MNPSGSAKKRGRPPKKKQNEESLEGNEDSYEDSPSSSKKFDFLRLRLFF